MLQRFLLSLLFSTITFGIIYSFNYLYLDEKLSKLWHKYNLFDKDLRVLVNGSITSSISIVSSMIIFYYLHNYFSLLKHPFIDIISIIIATIIIIIIYKYSHKLYKIHYQKNEKKLITKDN